MKPVLYGALAARLAGVPLVVNALTGMGYIFASQSLVARALMPGVRRALRLLLRHGRVIVQNRDDAALVRSLGIKSIHGIRGSGVDTRVFSPAPKAPPPPPIIMLVSRLLWDKGVGEFVEAARQFKASGMKARFVLVGSPDRGNRSSIPEATVTQWVNEGLIEWWGRRDDVSSVLRQAHVACLPSYREGVPKSLIEAAAAGLPIVTTDTPGCREIVLDGESGILVPPRDATALASALEELVGDPELRRRMGAKGRELVEAEFTTERVIASTLALYRDMAKPAGDRVAVPESTE
jgi:glycosyltransferase involved in cell wall biosynthesis